MARQNGDDTEERVSHFLGLVDLSESERNQPATSEPLSLDHQNEEESCATLSMELENAQKEITEKDEEITRLNRKLQMSIIAVRQLLALRNQLNEEKNEAKATMQEVLCELDEVHSELLHCKMEIDEKEFTVSELKTDAEEKSQEIKKLKKEHQEKDKEIRRNEQHFRRLREDLKDKQQESQKTLERLNDTYPALAKAEENNQKLARLADRLEIEGARLELKARRLTDKVAKLEKNTNETDEKVAVSPTQKTGEPSVKASGSANSDRDSEEPEGKNVSDTEPSTSDKPAKLKEMDARMKKYQSKMYYWKELSSTNDLTAIIRMLEAKNEDLSQQLNDERKKCSHLECEVFTLTQMNEQMGKFIHTIGEGL